MNNDGKELMQDIERMKYMTNPEYEKLVQEKPWLAPFIPEHLKKSKKICKEFNKLRFRKRQRLLQKENKLELNEFARKVLK